MREDLFAARRSCAETSGSSDGVATGMTILLVRLIDFGKTLKIFADELSVSFRALVRAFPATALRGTRGCIFRSMARVAGSNSRSCFSICCSSSAASRLPKKGCAPRPQPLRPARRRLALLAAGGCPGGLQSLGHRHRPLHGRRLHEFRQRLLSRRGLSRTGRLLRAGRLAVNRDCCQPARCESGGCCDAGLVATATLERRCCESGACCEPGPVVNRRRR